MAVRPMPEKPETEELEVTVEVEERPTAEVLRDNAISAAIASITSSFFNDIIIPGFQDLGMSIVEWFTGNVESYSERAIYGESEDRSYSYRRDNHGRSHVAYDKKYDRLPMTAKERRQAAIKRAEERQERPQGAKIVTKKLKSPVDPHYIVFPNEDAARRVHKILMRQASDYGTVRMADLYNCDEVGIEPSYTDMDIGWTFQDVRRAPIARSQGGYVIDLPPYRDLTEYE